MEKNITLNEYKQTDKELYKSRTIVNNKLAKNFRMIFLTLALIILINMALFTYLFNQSVSNSERITNIDQPLANKVLEIKYLVTKGHLYFEEAISGDENENLDEIYAFWHKSMAICDDILKENGVFAKTFKNTEIFNKIILIRNNTKNLIVAAKNRYKNRETGNVGSEMDQMFDDSYEVIMVDAETISQQLKKITESNLNDFKLLYKTGFIIVALMTLISFFALMVALQILRKKVSDPIALMAMVTEQFTAGNKAARISFGSDDEIGQLSDSLNNMFLTIANTTEELINEKKGVEKKVKDAVEDSEMARFDLQKKMNELLDVTAEVEAARNKAEQSHKVIREQEIYLRKQVDKLIRATNKVSEGDLTVKLEIEQNDEISELISSINNMINDLSTLVLQEKQISHSVLTISDSVNQSFGNFTKISEEQGQRISNIAASINEMAATISQNTESILFASELSLTSSNISKQGMEKIQLAVNSMRTLSEFIHGFDSITNKLDQNSTKISDITGIIADIADQTNLLALNASIEAARAGEHGRGFTIVSNEIKKLAEKTVNATKEIRDVTSQINNQIKSSVKSIEQGVKETNKCEVVVKQAGDIFVDIVNNSKELETTMMMVTKASKEQFYASGQVEENMGYISKYNDTLQSSLIDNTKKIKQLSFLISDLNRSVQKFVV